MKKTTMYLDAERVERLRKELGVDTDADAVRTAIDMALRSLASRRIATYAGMEKGQPLAAVPRRREPPAGKARARVKKSA